MPLGWLGTSLGVMALGRLVGIPVDVAVGTSPVVMVFDDGC